MDSFKINSIENLEEQAPNLFLFTKAKFILRRWINLKGKVNFSKYLMNFLGEN